MSRVPLTCPFCEIVLDRAPADVRHRWHVESTDPTGWGHLLEVIAFTPLAPVTPGHVLIVPHTHVEHAAADPLITSVAAQCAARYAGEQGGDFNIITSAGPAATQTVRHLHLHYVPRRPDDGLALPWSGWPAG